MITHLSQPPLPSSARLDTRAPDGIIGLALTWLSECWRCAWPRPVSLITSRSTTRSLRTMAHAVSCLASHCAMQRVDRGEDAQVVLHQRQAKTIFVQDQHHGCHTHHTRMCSEKCLTKFHRVSPVLVAKRPPGRHGYCSCRRAPSRRIHDVSSSRCTRVSCPSPRMKCERFLLETTPFREWRLSRSPACFCLRLSRAKPFDSTFGPAIGWSSFIKTGER